MKKKIAIVGFGCAGYYAAKTLRKYDGDCEIDVFSDTDTAPANPLLTTYYVSGKIPREEMFPFGSLEQVIREERINFFPDRPVKKLHALEPSLEFADGEKRRYDDVILATGSHPLVPPIPGMPEEGVYTMRTVDDADAMLAGVVSGMDSALVVGASWVGIKVVEALHRRGVTCTLVDQAPYIFSTAAFPETAKVCETYFESLGVKQRFGCGLSSMEKTEDGIVSRFSDGSEIKTSVVALCLGLRASVGFVDPAEVEMGRGVRTDSHMQSSVPHVYAVGDCSESVELMSKMYMGVNLWANAVNQGKIAAKHILGIPAEYEGSFAHNITHVLGMDFVGLGSPRLEGEKISSGAGTAQDFVMVTVKDHVLQCVNILGNYRCSGTLKTWFLRQQEKPAGKMPLSIRANLLREGFTEKFIEQIGGGTL